MSNDMITITISEDQGALLLSLVDQANAATKNCLVTAVLATGEYHDEAESLARRSETLTATRGKIQRAINA